MDFKPAFSTLDYKHLDLAVARAGIDAGERCIRIDEVGRPSILNVDARWEAFHPTANWAHAGPFIELDRIWLRPVAEEWAAACSDGKRVYFGRGPSPLLAGMQAYVT